MKAITTRYIGPSNTRGSRITATAEGGNRVVISYDPALNSDGAHMKAAITLCEKMGWGTDIIGGGTDNGYVFVFSKSTPRNNC
jgi:hypothetical protein